MPVEIRVPPLGESLVDAVVGQWLKSEGDPVTRGETILELETDKVNLDVTADEDGVLASIAHSEGDVVTVGEVLGTISAGAVAAQRGVCSGAGCGSSRARTCCGASAGRGRCPSSSRSRGVRLMARDAPRPPCAVWRKSTISI